MAPFITLERKTLTLDPVATAALQAIAGSLAELVRQQAQLLALLAQATGVRVEEVDPEAPLPGTPAAQRAEADAVEEGVTLLAQDDRDYYFEELRAGVEARYGRPLTDEQLEDLRTAFAQSEHDGTVPVLDLAR